LVPEGVIRTESLGFSGDSDEADIEGTGNKLLIDDIRITSAPGISDIITDRSPANLMSVYPNPFTDYLNVTFSDPGRYDISITDVAGREVYRKAIDAIMNSPISLPLAGFSSGVYTISTGGLNTKPLRIVKN
jgi:hypothetical protein